MVNLSICFVLTLTAVSARPQGIESILAPARVQELHRRAISPDVLLKNGQLAQSLNAKYAGMSLDTPCQVGDNACIQGGFAQCVAGKYVQTGCAPPTSCFELPLLLKAGTVPGCTTSADAASRISNTGAKGGVKGDGADTAATGNSTAPATPSTTADSPTSSAPVISETADANSTANSTDASPPSTTTTSPNATSPKNEEDSDQDASQTNGTDMGMAMGMENMSNASLATTMDPSAAVSDSSVNATSPIANSSDSGSNITNATSTATSPDDNSTPLANTTSAVNATNELSVSGNTTAPAEDEECVEN
ncbi:hypothetical protein CROQUDRAFT_87646 [Cronartium quercuum f. sp. fusiforme G11]|uniref:Carbohydrate-binding module family 19 domain-containing protein n=1 Tax=Cronartium quercuum f. sp. fusiforme G11 TaxID=708437 RepID=A0A9P6NSH3_9BASI|nr:hypothetical protein CROQUDRAFT_87646 [Cronartium quercuum f. sp. fusiforme G11]